MRDQVLGAAELAEESEDFAPGAVLFGQRQRLTQQYGEGLVLTFEVDPTLMGGLRIRVGDQLIDNTVANRLMALRELVAASVR